MSVLAFSGNITGAVRVAPRPVPTRLDVCPTGATRKLHIRPYQPSDRPAITRICGDTGFLGNAVEPLFQDRELFADLFTKAYLDYEPQWAFVAEADGRLAGYLLGSVCPHFDRLLMRAGLQTVSRMLYRLFTGRYSQHPRSRQFIRWLITAGFWEQPKHPADSAHLHFNLARPHRGRGLGRQLWQTYEQRLKEAGVARCYGSFFSYSRRRPEAAYARFGFRTYDRCRTTLFEPDIADAIEVVCVWKEF
jgi:GNAT superfamily N-acetyltransferase